MAELLYIVQNPAYPNDKLPSLEDFVRLMRGESFVVWVQRSDQRLERLEVSLSKPDDARFSFGIGLLAGRPSDSFEQGQTTETFELVDVVRVTVAGNRRRTSAVDKLVLHHEAVPSDGRLLASHGFIDVNRVTWNYLFPGEGGGWPGA